METVDNGAMLPARDAELVQIVEAALTDATRRAQRPEGDSWLACRPGCTPCCHGVFRISALDAERLRTELRATDQTHPELATAIRSRARTFVDNLRTCFPGDADSGLLTPEDAAWDAFADLPETDIACPVLDPASGRCSLYNGRPLTCRIFGPPVINEGGLGLCELCYIGAPEADILHGEMFLEHHALEEDLNRELLRGETNGAGETVIAWALLP